MKRETWKTVIQMVISILTAALTATGHDIVHEGLRPDGIVKAEG